MTLSVPQLGDYTSHIDKILSASDLATVSVKKVRTQLLDIVGSALELTAETKPALNKLIEQRFDVALQAKEGDGVKEEEDSEKERDERPKKRVKREADADADDEKLAKLLQAEENKSSRATRATRGAAKKGTKEVKKTEKKARKKREKKVETPEYDEEGNEIVKKKTGVFNREWALSEPLSVLVGGATQLSRPQTVKKIWEHIKAHDLQVPTDKRQIVCDNKMKAVFKCDQVHMFTMNKLLGKHFYPIEGEEAHEPKPKAEKTTKVKKEKGDGKKSAKVVKEESEEEEEEAIPTPRDTSEEVSFKDESESPETREETPASEES